jgi:hypothetical protein
MGRLCRHAGVRRTALRRCIARRPRGAAGADPARPAGRPRPEAAGLAGQATLALRAASRWRSRAACGWTASTPTMPPPPAPRCRRRRRRDGGGRLRPDPAAVGAGPAAPGCLNIHASLLPRWRGAAPIHRAIEAGDTQTGITIMQMDAGLDTGAMLLAEHAHRRRRHHRQPARPPGRAGRATDRRGLAAAAGRCGRVPQPAVGITYAHKIDKAEAAIDWTLPAAVIERRVRAFDPFPGRRAGRTKRCSTS